MLDRKTREQLQYRMENAMMKGSQGGIETLNRGTSPKKRLLPYYLKLGLETEE